MDVPRGLEVLVNKAAVDAAFRDALVRERAAAAARIGLVLEPAEAAMLDAIAAPQLETVIANTTVPPRFRAAFMGYAAAAMLAAVGLGVQGCIPTGGGAAGGARADYPPPGTGSGEVSAPTAVTAAAAATAATASTAATAGTGGFNLGLGDGLGESHTGSSPGIGGIRPDKPVGDGK
jgi:hypothetical protein